MTDEDLDEILIETVHAPELVAHVCRLRIERDNAIEKSAADRRNADHWKSECSMWKSAAMALTGVPADE